MWTKCTNIYNIQVWTNDAYLMYMTLCASTPSDWLFSVSCPLALLAAGNNNRARGCFLLTVCESPLKPFLLSSIPSYTYIDFSHRFLTHYTPHGPQVPYWGQVLNLGHCLYNTMGRYRWSVFSDYDEYLVPLSPARSYIQVLAVAMHRPYIILHTNYEGDPPMNGPIVHSLPSSVLAAVSGHQE